MRQDIDLVPRRMYLRVILCISRMQGNRLQVQPAIEIDRGNDIPLVCEISLTE
jgi:hypothetical protein